ncbi:hypothetical protein [Nocardia arthritidis]|uniref:Uncharacterized protein n=1 Tax=Nocardia arthritidis TaxID=228602 RepID=A0A6G9YKX0_9NOCA|nr:hypothetical protein [Nocardia arthritidis]QIS13831.1 hypothetical protein F5544_29930 [Nocardia arthritidis]
MSTAISEIATAPVVEDDLGFDTVPRVRTVHPPVLRARTAAALYRPAVDRRPRGARPRAAVVAYDARPLTPRQSRSVYPMQRVEEAKVGFAALAVSALLSALVVTALIGLGHWRAGTFDHGTPAPAPMIVDGSAPQDGVAPR